MNWIFLNDIYTYAGLFGMVAFASGGNVSVGATDYHEFVPTSGHGLLIMLSAWWAIGAVVDAVSNLILAILRYPLTDNLADCIRIHELLVRRGSWGL